MPNFRGRTRFVTLLAAGTVLLVSGVTLGVIGSILILGGANDARTTDTSLTTHTAGIALSVAQTGNGVAIRGGSDSATGIAGLFTSLAGTGLVGIVQDPNGFAIDASNASESTGVGAGIRANGRYNVGIVAESFSASAIVALATGAAPAIVATAPYRTAIRASGAGGGDVEDCTALFCAGTESTGAIGVIAGTATPDGTGLYAIDQTPDRSGFAVIAEGDTILDGTLSVTGGCLGCTSLTIARNGSGVVVRQGDAVTVLGLEVTDDGATILIVGPARAGEAVIGVVDRALYRATSPARSASVGGGWRVGGTEIGAGSDLRLATDGMLTMDVPLADVPAGARLVTGAEAGRLVVGDGEGGTRVGTYLGVRPDGKGVMLIDPD